MAVPFTRLASQVLDNYNLKLNDALKRFDGIISVLGSNGAIQYETGGGENFRERILYGENSNISFQSKNQQIGTVDDDGITMASVPQRTISGSIVINQVERDQVAEGSKWAIGNLMKDKMQQFMSTWVRVHATALRQAVPGANDPYTLLPSGTSGTINGILSPVAPAAAAGTTAGISRADNDWWRNQYTNQSIDISGEAGRALLYSLLYQNCVFGASLEDEPNFGVCSGAVLGDIGAAIDTNRRADYEDNKMFKLGFRGIMFFNAMLIRDSSTRFANKIALINTRDLVIKCLKSQGGKYRKDAADENNNLGTIPVNMSDFQRDIDSLNDVALAYSVCSLVPKQLRTHGLADNVV